MCKCALKHPVQCTGRIKSHKVCESRLQDMVFFMKAEQRRRITITVMLVRKRGPSRVPSDRPLSTPFEKALKLKHAYKGKIATLDEKEMPRSLLWMNASAAAQACLHTHR